MICPLIAAAELNDRFRAAVEDLLVTTGDDAKDRMLRDMLTAKIADFSYRLGTLTSMDLRNFEVYAGMQEVLFKTGELIDKGRI